MNASYGVPKNIYEKENRRRASPSNDATRVFASRRGQLPCGCSRRRMTRRALAVLRKLASAPSAFIYFSSLNSFTYFPARFWSYISFVCSLLTAFLCPLIVQAQSYTNSSLDSPKCFLIFFSQFQFSNLKGVPIYLNNSITVIIHIETEES